MFTLSAVPVKFIGLLIFFAFTTAYETYQLVKATSARGRISHGLHWLMSVIMLLMVPKNIWVPFRTVVPVPVSIFLMVLGVIWFGYLAVMARPGHRAHPTGCTLMFAAMAWHLAAMMVKMQNMKAMGGMSGGSHGGMSGGSHGGMGGGMNHQLMWGGHSALWWMALIGIPLMAYLLYASIRAVALALKEPSRRIEALSDFAMNFGMFWMSTGLMTPILPFFKYLAF
ncbi:hypothetical protein AAEX63_00680 [Luteococcus sp. H138]|uniref:hypothetical protein n=1 Tax=unclassified Luteococcus TaxID=2639923 RepID=UPI00313B9B53